MWILFVVFYGIWIIIIYWFNFIYFFKYYYRSMIKIVVVIGVGLVGLVVIKSCLEVGFELIVFEIDFWLGGVWKYIDLIEEKCRRSCVVYFIVINISKYVSCYSDFFMFKEWFNFFF